MTLRDCVSPLTVRISPSSSFNLDRTYRYSELPENAPRYYNELRSAIKDLAAMHPSQFDVALSLMDDEAHGHGLSEVGKPI